ncbi:hypothetical protein EL79_5013 [Escherichia coli]|uniref:Uncharacterized protein n=1 Tax=Escherichia coli O81 (strain ED1a) TaxID=585397 RepID=B7LII4_ECO81|nr:hypothetical protein EL79_5013 [Escherichia coli]CAQ87252.1 hypothetical protein pECED1a_0035 [Escherichia coli ED1a]
MFITPPFSVYLVYHERGKELNITTIIELQRNRDEIAQLRREGEKKERLYLVSVQKPPVALS